MPGGIFTFSLVKGVTMGILTDETVDAMNQSLGTNWAGEVFPIARGILRQLEIGETKPLWSVVPRVEAGSFQVSVAKPLDLLLYSILRELESGGMILISVDENFTQTVKRLK